MVYMTKQRIDGEYSEAQIEAGIDLLTGYLGDQELSWGQWREVLPKLYRLGTFPQHHETQCNIGEQLLND